jgi:hypothetical protein
VAVVDDGGVATVLPMLVGVVLMDGVFSRHVWVGFLSGIR